MRDTCHLLRAKTWIIRNGFARPEKSERWKSLFFFGLSLLFLGGLFFGALMFFQRLAGEEPFGGLLANKLIEFLYLTFFAVLVFSGVVTSLNAFFLDDDLPTLVTAPITHGRLYVARFIQTFVMTGWMVLLFGFPVFIAYGLVFHAPLHFYPWMFFALLAFEILPVALGSLLTMILVKSFPARKMQDILIILAVLLVVALYFLFRFLRPEQLFNPDVFHGFAEYFATLKTPDSPLLPPTWGVIALTAPLAGKTGGDGVFYLLLMIAYGLFAVLLGSSLANRVYLDAFTKSQEGRRMRFTRLSPVQSAFSRLAGNRDPVARQFYLKEIRSFFRDTSQWTQLLLLLALIVVYLFNFKALDLDRFAGVTVSLRATISYLNLILAGFVVSAVSVRFVLPAVSLEGNAFWIVRTAPVSIKQFLWGKFRFYAVPLFVISEMLVVLSNYYLRSTAFMMIFSAIVMGFLAFGITGLAVGVGAVYPNFEEKNVARMSTGVSAIIYMAMALGFNIFVVGVLAFPAEILRRFFFRGSHPSHLEWAIVGLSFIVVFPMILLFVFVPMRKGIRALESREM